MHIYKSEGIIRFIIKFVLYVFFWMLWNQFIIFDIIFKDGRVAYQRRYDVSYYFGLEIPL